MSNNETISRARGECRHSKYENEYFPYYGGWINRCKECNELFDSWEIPDYENDPGAWTPELYEWIEEQGLFRKLLAHLTD